MPLKPLRITTVQAANTVAVTEGLSDWLSTHGPVPVQFQPTGNWRQMYAEIEAGEMDLAWICGRPYVEMMARAEPPVELLVAPVMRGGRYADQPIYFSDVVVRAESPFQEFSDLRGARWAFNEPGSQSGYHITCYQLAMMGESAAFFGHIEAAGSHAAALEAILAGRIDAAAIDSTFLSWMTDRDPSVAEEVRIIASLGPSPIPPIVAARSIDQSLRHQLRALLSNMHAMRDGQGVLHLGDVARFTVVEDSDYDAIRRMASVSRDISLLQ